VETETNRLGNPDVGTAQQESLEADVDQYFKDLLEASSLGTPAARRIRESAPAGLADDVRRRIMTREEGHPARPQLAAPGNPQPGRPARFGQLRLHSAAFRATLDDTPKVRLVPATARPQQDRPDDASYDHPCRALDGNGTTQAESASTDARSRAGTQAPEDLTAGAWHLPALSYRRSPGTGSVPPSPAVPDPGNDNNALLYIVANPPYESPLRIPETDNRSDPFEHSVKALLIRHVIDRWASDLDYSSSDRLVQVILRDHVIPETSRTRSLRHEPERMRFLTDLVRDAGLRDFLASAARQPSRILADAAALARPWDTATLHLAETAIQELPDIGQHLVCRDVLAGFAHHESLLRFLVDATARQPSRGLADATIRIRCLWNTASIRHLAETAIQELPDTGQSLDNLRRYVIECATLHAGESGTGKTSLHSTFFHPAAKENARDVYPELGEHFEVMARGAYWQVKTVPVTPGDDDATRNAYWDADWTSHAACKGTDPDELFVQGAAQNQAKLVCRGCPVRTECLADALDSGIEFGVWGGMTERERRALLRRRPDVTSWRELLMAARARYERREITELVALPAGNSSEAAVSQPAQAAGRGAAWQVSSA
jgi:WhiB family transcriptional regulator, redox-sensing transcriptional regulator